MDHIGTHADRHTAARIAGMTVRSAARFESGLGLYDGGASVRTRLRVVDQPGLPERAVQPCLDPGVEEVLLNEERDIVIGFHRVGVPAVDTS